MNISQQLISFFSEGINTPSFNHNYFRKQELIAAYARNLEAINQLLYEGYESPLAPIRLTPEAQQKLEKILQADAGIQLATYETLSDFFDALGFITRPGSDDVLRIYLD